MENLSCNNVPNGELTDEQSEFLWDMIEDVEQKKEGSLFKLAAQLTGGSEWINPTISE